jgi:hypothetical protein
MPTPTGPVTLGDLIREDKLLWVAIQRQRFRVLLANTLR